MSQKIKTLLLTLILLFTVVAASPPPTATAAVCKNPGVDTSCECSSQGCDNGRPAMNPKNCSSGRVDQQDASKCAPLGNTCNGNKAEVCVTKLPIIGNLNQVVNFLAAAVGVIVVAVIILGGIQYTMAGDNPNAVGEARKRITNGLIALVTFIFMYAFLQWLIPGGTFK